MCKHCGKVVDLMASRTFAIDEDGKLTTYHFCCETHMNDFMHRKDMSLGES